MTRVSANNYSTCGETFFGILHKTLHNVENNLNDYQITARHSKEKRKKGEFLSQWQ